VWTQLATSKLGWDETIQPSNHPSIRVLVVVVVVVAAVESYAAHGNGVANWKYEC
jgi:hypothetical protein